VRAPCHRTQLSLVLGSWFSAPGRPLLSSFSPYIGNLMYIVQRIQISLIGLPSFGFWLTAITLSRSPGCVKRLKPVIDTEAQGSYRHYCTPRKTKYPKAPSLYISSSYLSKDFIFIPFFNYLYCLLCFYTQDAALHLFESNNRWCIAT
jgi:hypothetical protein